MIGRVVAGWVIVHGVNVAVGRNGDRQPGAECRCAGDQPPQRPSRCREFGVDAARGKDWRLPQLATLFGGVTVRLLRFRCTDCGRTEPDVSWASDCRSTPELDQLQAHLSALMPYRVAAGVLQHVLPVEAGKSPELLRGHTLKVGEQLRNAPTVKPDGRVGHHHHRGFTFIRGCHNGERPGVGLHCPKKIRCEACKPWLARDDDEGPDTSDSLSEPGVSLVKRRGSLGNLGPLSASRCSCDVRFEHGGREKWASGARIGQKVPEVSGVPVCAVKPDFLLDERF